MPENLLPIFQNAAVLERTSAATQQVLQQRAQPLPAGDRFLSPELFAVLQQITASILPQDAVGTDVDIAGAIDKRLREGKNAGWRFADLPPDGEAYVQGLTIFTRMLQQTPTKHFTAMPQSAREGYLRCVANGDVDGPAQFPLAKWLGMLRTDVVRMWIAHPSAMQAMEYYGFADGATGETSGPVQNEGWRAITTNKALPFEHGVDTPAVITGREA